MIALRDYQEEALSKLFDYWATEKGKAPIIAAPTGSGKSLIIGEFCRRVCTEDSHVKIMVLAHVRELLTQNEKELKAVWPEASTGIYSAGLGKKQTMAQITFAGIQSVYSHVFEFGKVDIVIVDECHLIPRSADTRYGKFFKDMKMANPDVAIFGLSASPYRLDSGMLHEGDGALFDGIAYSVDIKKLIKDGYLVNVISKGGISKIDLTGVKIQAGDYAPGELAHAADSPELIKSAVNEIVECGSDRKAWLLFCSGVEHVEHVANAVKQHGIGCEVITGDTPKEKRDEVISKFKNGKLRCIANVGVMTTGINIPRCDLIALLTSTRSTGKYIQMVGRSMRPFPDKENALLLDFGGNVLEHGPIDAVEPVKRKTMLGNPVVAAPLKECPKCHVIVHARVTVCGFCGYAFPVVAPHGTTAYDGAVMMGQVKAETVQIAGVWYSRHKKAGKPDSVKVTFYTKLDKEYYTYLGLDHGGYFAEKSLAIVRRFGGKATNVTDALKESIVSWRKPVAISVKPRGPYFDVVGIAFDDTVKPEVNHKVQATLFGGFNDDRFTPRR
jgi:DNA repair protein RadD